MAKVASCSVDDHARAPAVSGHHWSGARKSNRPSYSLPTLTRAASVAAVGADTRWLLKIVNPAATNGIVEDASQRAISFDNTNADETHARLGNVNALKTVDRAVDAKARGGRWLHCWLCVRPLHASWVAAPTRRS
jgi:hypothetical protein